MIFLFQIYQARERVGEDEISRLIDGQTSKLFSLFLR